MKKKITLERTYDAPIDDVWDLWTTKDGIESFAAYEVGTIVELFPTESGVRMVLSLEPMHDEQWTERAVMGWESELGKLAKVLERAPKS